MDNNIIATLVGVGVQTMSTILQSYVTFKKTNVEKYFELLIQEKKDLSKIGSNDSLRKIFFVIIDNASNEVTEEKISNWKNLTIKLATTLDDLDFSEDYAKTLADLTPFDLTVLFAIYSNNFKSKFFNAELLEYFKSKNVIQDKVFHSLKGLSRHYLVTEQADGMTYLYNGEQSGQQFFYEKNDFGQEFLSIISD